ncbi:MAG: hypothetical protein JXB49_24705 [Bacteroidales bacterium]|nr:hypothetical protein [Bacteroidales bacterium]
MAFEMDASAKAGQTQEQINTCKVILNGKVDQTQYNADIQNIKESLQSIEKKLDQHIIK